MNTKYTLEMTLGLKANSNKTYSDRPMVCKSIREAKERTKNLDPKAAKILNKRGQQIHAYTVLTGWTQAKPKKQSQTWLITVGYSLKKRKPITVPYSQYNV